MKPLNAITSYFQGVLAELRKVQWPTLPVLLKYLVSVVVGIGIATLVIGAIDYVFFRALSFFISK